jgi:RND superfamily putative drug exporter
MAESSRAPLRAGIFPKPRHLAARMGRWSATHRKVSIFGWIAFVLAALAMSAVVGTRNLTDAESGTGESGRAEKILAGAGFEADDSEHVLVQSRSLEAREPKFQSTVHEVEGRLARIPGVSGLKSPYSDGNAELISDDGRSVLIQFEYRGPDIQEPVDAVASAQRAHPGFYMGQIGEESAEKAIDDTIGKDFKRAELFSIPLTLAILLLAFGALVAAGVPVLIAITAVLAATGLLAPVSHVFPADDSAGSIILLIGLAVGVDYSLFYLRREREERARGASPEAALEIAAATSGRAIWFSGLTVLIAMAGMLFSGSKDIASVGTGAMLVVAVALLGSLTVLPALLSLLGDRVEKGRIPLWYRLRKGGESRVWGGVLDRVLRRPALAALVAGAPLVALTAVAFQLQTIDPGLASLPPKLGVVETYKRLQDAFSGSAEPAAVVIRADVDAPGVKSAIADLRKRAAATPELAGPSSVDVNPGRTVVVVSIPLAGHGTDAESARALRKLRRDVIPTTVGSMAGAEVAVTGATASSLDFSNLLKRRAPLVFTFVLTLAFVLLLVAFRSLVIAAKAVALNLLSVGAAYGLLVIVFQHGFGESLLGFEANGGVVTWLPLLLFVVLFGLSMDYHVFLLSRIREAVDRGVATEHAVAHAIKTTAGTVTSAALVMVAVFSIFATLSPLQMKQLGVGLASAILIDATIVRAVLLPATMKLLGRWNWYLPRWLEWMPRFSIEGPQAPGPMAGAVTQHT